MATPGGTPRRTPARRTPARRTLPGSELWQRGVAASDGGAGSQPASAVTANGAVADTAAAAAQADAPETYEEGHKNPWVAVLLWLVGGIFGWHHLYLGRAVHAFTWMISLGGFGIGLLYDLYRMTWYVDEANLHQRVRDAYGMFAATKRRQALFSARTLGQVFFGAILRQITIWAVPQEPEDGVPLALEIATALSTIVVGTYVYLLGVEGGARKGSLWLTILGALLGEVITIIGRGEDVDLAPGCNGSFNSALVVAFAASLVFIYTSRFVPMPPKVPKSALLRQLVAVLVAVGLFWAGIGSYVFNNTTMNIDEHGEAKRFKDIVREFLNSNAWAQLKQQFNSCARDWEACFNTVSEHVNVGGLRGAYSVLGLKEGVDFSEVKQARNKLSLKWHPDRCEASKKAQCAKKFREVEEAYEKISQAMGEGRSRRKNRRRGGYRNN